MPKFERQNIKEDEKFMRLCVVLAQRGSGKVSPNPMVGSVIVHRGKIIGRGWHKKFGEAHAEVNAIHSVQNENQLKESTLYVNLEPCSHFGKTPPCVDLIIEKKISRVVIGTIDPHKKVAGKGILKLKSKGISVTQNVLHDVCNELNESFFKFHQEKMPFVAIKLAQTLDGKIATKSKDSKWITSEAARAYAHHLRAKYDAILIGTGTALADNPALTVRFVKGRNPKRILLDRKLRIPLQANILDGSVSTTLFTSRINRKHPKALALTRKGIMVQFVGEKGDELNLKEVFEKLYEENILSVMIEGGSQLVSSLLKAKLCDKVHLLIAPKFLGSDALGSIGAMNFSKVAQGLSLKRTTVKILNDTLIVEGYLNG